MTCRHCGLPESEHHDYEPAVVLPEGCICDAREWANPVHPICPAYRCIDSGDRCVACEHDEACHKRTET